MARLGIPWTATATATATAIGLAVVTAIAFRSAPACAQSLLLRPPEAPPPAGYNLRPTAGGGYTYEEEAWRAAIAPDGTVDFQDRNVTITSLRLGPIDFKNGPPAGRPTLQGALRNLFRERPPPDPWAESRAPIWKYHADPRDACGPRSGCYFVPMGSSGLVSASGLMDLTDIYMRWVGQDPYRRAKARFLTATFDLRMKMASRHQGALVRRSLRDLPARLDELWSDSSRPAVEKRQVLFSLWSEAGDDEAGSSARAIIERFIRERLPRGTPDAFTDAELARFGDAPAAPPARRFAPYDAGPSDRDR